MTGKARWRMAATAAAAAMLVATVQLAASASTVTVSAVQNNPGTNPTNPAVSYEGDCTTSLEAGQVAPFLTELNGSTSVTTAFPSGVAFGYSGSATTKLVGAFIANLEIFGVASSHISMQWTETLGSTNGHATGSYTYNSPTISQPASGGKVTGVSWGSGSTTLTAAKGAFSGAAKGDGLASSANGLPSDALVTSVASDGSSVAITTPTTAAGSNATVGYAAPMTFTDNSLNTGDVFTTNGPNGSTAGIGVTGIKDFSVGASLTIVFGGPGANCTETGWDVASNPGPAQSPATQPVFPPGTTTPLVVAGAHPVFPPAASVDLVEPPPTAGNVSTNLGVGQSSTANLAAAPGNPAFPVTSCALVPGSISLVSGNGPASRLAVSVSGPGPCSASLTDSGSGAATITFQYTAKDGYPLTSPAGTVKVDIGTAGIGQGFSEHVKAGKLVLSCRPPTQHAQPTCPIIHLPQIKLNGTTQKRTAPANTIYVSDNRGSPKVGWSLTTFMVASTGGNHACKGMAAFCNQTIGGNAKSPNGHIPAKDLAISAPKCDVDKGNLNPKPTSGKAGHFNQSPGALTLCTAAISQSGGTFTMNTNFTLTVPAAIYAGRYVATIEYLVT